MVLLKQYSLQGLLPSKHAIEEQGTSLEAPQMQGLCNEAAFQHPSLSLGLAVADSP